MDERFLQAENIIFDIGNVLLRFRPERVCEKMPEDIRADLQTAMFESKGREWRWGAFDLGDIPNEEIAIHIARAAGHEEAAVHILKALEYFPETLEEMPLVNCLAPLKKLGKRLYALTNYPEPSFTITKERFSFFSQLDGYVVSSREKVTKPDESIFRIILEKYALCPEKTLFIDDSAANVETAARMGLQTWHYTAWQEMK